MVYTEMLKYLFEKNRENDVMKLRQNCNLSMDDVSVETTGVNESKYFIKSSVKNYALRCLTKTCNENRKTQHLEYDTLTESPPYFTALSPQTARIIFKMTGGLVFLILKLTSKQVLSQPQLRNDKYIMMQYTNWINPSPSQ